MNARLPQLKHLYKAQSGVALMEFALVLPLFLLAGLYGVDVAYQASAQQKISHVALNAADNASRIGQGNNTNVVPTLNATEVYAILVGALRQGKSIDLEKNGRVFISSLEENPANQEQYIHWQRCIGDLNVTSAYGKAEERPLPNGMGKPGKEIKAPSGYAVMYAEVYYEYKSLFGSLFMTEPVRMKQEAAFLVRDSRNLEDGLLGAQDQTSQCLHTVAL